MNGFDPCNNRQEPPSTSLSWMLKAFAFAFKFFEGSDHKHMEVEQSSLAVMQNSLNCFPHLFSVQLICEYSWESIYLSIYICLKWFPKCFTQIALSWWISFKPLIFFLFLFLSAGFVHAFSTDIVGYQSAILVLLLFIGLYETCMRRKACAGLPVV